MQSALILSALALVLSACSLVFVAWAVRAMGKAMGEARVRVGDWVETAMQDQLDAASGLVGQAEELIPQLKAWNGRALATIRHGEAKVKTSEASEDVGGGLPPWLMAAAQHAGLDVDALKAGDQAELQKAATMLQRLAGSVGPGGGQPADEIAQRAL